MRIDICGRTDVGRVRKKNEDSYRLVPTLNPFALSDGIGITTLLRRIAAGSDGVVARLRRWAGRSPEAAASSRDH